MAVVRRILRFLQQEAFCRKSIASVLLAVKAKKDPEKYQKFFKGYSYFLKARDG